MMPDTGLYIHIPFCLKKCRYCDFYSITDLTWKRRYLFALLKELRLRSDLDSRVDTVYFGGGTPSVMSHEEVEEVLAAIDRSFKLLKDAVITMEVNPGTIIKQKGSVSCSKSEPESAEYCGRRDYLSNIRKAGINRLSIGVQSFDDRKLEFLKRIHSSEDALKTIESARSAGFSDIGIDLIYGLPEESEEIWERDLEKALRCSPEHLSCYMLSYEKGTPLFESMKRREFFPLDDTKGASLFRFTSNYLTSHGFIHYEISNFASSSDKRSSHNMKYWQMAPYHGFGPAAHSYDGISTRSWNVSDVRRYVEILENEALPVESCETLTESQEMIEMIMTGLRSSRGVEIDSFERLSKRAFSVQFESVIENVVKRGWGSVIDEAQSQRFVLTLEGMVFLDTVIEWFIDLIEIDLIN